MEKFGDGIKKYEADVTTYGLGAATTGFAAATYYSQQNHQKHAKKHREMETSRLLQSDVKRGRMSMTQGVYECKKVGLNPAEVFQWLDPTEEKNISNQNNLGSNDIAKPARIKTKKNKKPFASLSSSFNSPFTKKEPENDVYNERADNRATGVSAETADYRVKVSKEAVSYTGVNPSPVPFHSNSTSSNQGAMLAGSAGILLFTIFYVGGLVAIDHFPFLKSILRRKNRALIEQEIQMNEKLDKIYSVQNQILNKLNNK